VETSGAVAGVIISTIFAAICYIVLGIWLASKYAERFRQDEQRGEEYRAYVDELRSHRLQMDLYMDNINLFFRQRYGVELWIDRRK
jgi:hypothetical protein